MAFFGQIDTQSPQPLQLLTSRLMLGVPPICKPNSIAPCSQISEQDWHTTPTLDRQLSSILAVSPHG